MDTPASAIVPLAALDAHALLGKLSHLRLRASSLEPRAPVASCLRAPSSSNGSLPLRAALVASSCEEVAKRAQMLESRLLRFPDAVPHIGVGTVVARPDAVSSIGILFPGQASPARTFLGCLGEHVPRAAELHRQVGLPRSELPKDLTQLAVVASSLAALCALDSFGVKARFALGHSLGELVALHWAGAYDHATLLRLARVRGAAMTSDAGRAGAMAAIRTDESQLPGLLAEEEAVIACFNTPSQHVISGEEKAIEAIVRRARDLRIQAKRLDVTGAFHSPLMEAAARAFRDRIEPVDIGAIRRPVASTVTGKWIEPSDDIRGLLVRQIGSPVRFSRAVAIASDADLLIEAGPGRVLSGLVRELTDTPVFSLSADADERRLREAVATLWACGALRSAPRRLAGNLDPALTPV